MAFNLDFLLLRRPRLDYISPPICEVFFSSTGVVIELEPFASSIITGLALGGIGGGNLVWDVFPEAVCYNIYKESETPGVYDLILECTPSPEIPFPNPPGCYKVSAITPSGETDLSDPFCISTVPPTVLTLPEEDVEMTTAILNGAVNPMGGLASVFFQWGETLAYGNSTPAIPVGSSSANISFADVLEGLAANTTYHYRAAATNGAVLVVGLDEEFTTPGGGGESFPRCGHPEDVDIGLRPTIKNYNSGFFAMVNCFGTGAPEWDGFFVGGNADGQWCRWRATGLGNEEEGNLLAINGRQFQFIELRGPTSLIDDWKLSLIGLGTGPGGVTVYVWEGHGPVGDVGPAGIYTQGAGFHGGGPGTDPGPATIEIIYA